MPPLTGRPQPRHIGNARDARGRPYAEEPSVAAGTGFTAASGGFLHRWIERCGSVVKTCFLIDLTGTHSTAAGDIIGVDANANPAHIGRYLTAESGTPVAGSFKCIEAPAGGEPDIDVFMATVGTGVEDAAISGLTGQAALLASGIDYTNGAELGLTGMPSDGAYLYLVSSGGGDAAAYSGGKFLLTIYGVAA
jgi:hypothetical protein